MSKSDTWMPFYVGDYLSATGRLTTEQHGAYLLILLDYWKNGSPPNDDNVLAALARMSPAAWRKAKPALIGFFEVRDGLLIQKRVETERKRSVKVTEERSEAGKAGAAGKWGELAGKRGRVLRSERLTEARRKGTHDRDEWAALVAFCGDSCVRCGSAGRIVKDHITPIYQGGSDAIDNLQPLCGSCNSSKGADATDLRPNGWQAAVKTPGKCLTNGFQTSGPSQSHSSSSEELIASTNVDVSVCTDAPVTKHEIIEAWQSRMVPQGFPAIAKMTADRERKLKARIRDSTFEEWKRAMDALERSAFCRGENDRGWRADFDFLLQPKSFTKLLEGAYDH